MQLAAAGVLPRHRSALSASLTQSKEESSEMYSSFESRKSSALDVSIDGGVGGVPALPSVGGRLSCELVDSRMECRSSDLYRTVRLHPSAP
jgi:hypothetical protein